MVTQSNSKNSNSLLKRTVLVVEDNDLNREMLVDILSDSYNVIEAEDGVVGMEKLKEKACEAGGYDNVSIVLAKL